MIMIKGLHVSLDKVKVMLHPNLKNYRLYQCWLLECSMEDIQVCTSRRKKEASFQDYSTIC